MLKKISIFSLVALLSVHMNVYSGQKQEAFNVPVNSPERQEQCMEAAGLQNGLNNPRIVKFMSVPFRLQKPLSYTEDNGDKIDLPSGAFIRLNWSKDFLVDLIREEQQGRFLHRAADDYYKVQDKTVQWAQRKPKTAVAVGSLFAGLAFYGICLYKGYTKVPGVISLQNFGSFVGQKWANCFANKTSQAAATALGNAALKKAATIIK